MLLNFHSMFRGSLHCYAIGAVAAILLAMQFMNSYDNEVLYHGFGPSGY